MTRTEALTLALDALGKFSIGYHVDAVELNDLIATLEAALEQPEQVWLTGCPSCGMDGGCDCDEGTYNPMLNAGWGSEQPEQEPVAWVKTMYSGTRPMLEVDHLRKDTSTPVFTHPPRREWRGLTQEELSELARQEELLLICDDFDALREIARAIEAALKEKNHDQP